MSDLRTRQLRHDLTLATCVVLVLPGMGMSGATISPSVPPTPQCQRVLPQGCCRTAADSRGTFDSVTTAGVAACEALCRITAQCHGIGYTDQPIDNCRLHWDAADFHHSDGNASCGQCSVCYAVTPSPTPAVRSLKLYWMPEAHIVPATAELWVAAVTSRLFLTNISDIKRRRDRREVLIRDQADLSNITTDATTITLTLRRTSIWDKIRAAVVAGTFRIRVYGREYRATLVEGWPTTPAPTALQTTSTLEPGVTNSDPNSGGGDYRLSRVIIISLAVAVGVLILFVLLMLDLAKEAGQTDKVAPARLAWDDTGMPNEISRLSPSRRSIMLHPAILAMPTSRFQEQYTRQENPSTDIESVGFDADDSFEGHEHVGPVGPTVSMQGDNLPCASPPVPPRR